MESTAYSYFESLSDKFALFDANWESPAPWIVILDKSTNSWWTKLTCEENNVDFEKFVAWALEARKRSQKAEVIKD